MDLWIEILNLNRDIKETVKTNESFTETCEVLDVLLVILNITQGTNRNL